MLLEIHSPLELVNEADGILLQPRDRGMIGLAKPELLCKEHQEPHDWPRDIRWRSRSLRDRVVGRNFERQE